MKSSLGGIGRSVRTVDESCGRGFEITGRIFYPYTRSNSSACIRTAMYPSEGPVGSDRLHERTATTRRHERGVGPVPTDPVLSSPIRLDKFVTHRISYTAISPDAQLGHVCPGSGTVVPHRRHSRTVHIAQYRGASISATLFRTEPLITTR